MGIAAAFFAEGADATVTGATESEVEAAAETGVRSLVLGVREAGWGSDTYRHSDDGPGRVPVVS